jgi:hypothetical protein
MVSNAAQGVLVRREEVVVRRIVFRPCGVLN